MEQNGNKNVGEYQSVVNTVHFLTNEGEYELALQLSQCTLEKMHLVNNEKEEPDSIDDKQYEAVRRELTEKYLDVRREMDIGTRPYKQAFIKTLIVSGVISLCFLITLFLSGMIVKNQINGQVINLSEPIRKDVNTQMIRVTDKMLVHMAALSDVAQREMPKLLANKFANFSDTRITAIIESKTDKIVNEKLSGIVDKKLKRDLQASGEKR